MSENTGSVVPFENRDSKIAGFVNQKSTGDFASPLLIAQEETFFSDGALEIVQAVRFDS